MTEGTAGILVAIIVLEKILHNIYCASPRVLDVKEAIANDPSSSVTLFCDQNDLEFEKSI
ncbi:MAG: hypothetical protein K2O64_06590 [Lactobacillus sp.]|nr:hypothetical protein [Lactobacillus sp.]